jgi:hypothetical protein
MLESGHPGPALEFKNVFGPKTSLWSLRFSRTKRGCLGALSNTGCFKTFDIVKEYLSEEYRTSMDETLGEGSFHNYPEQIYTKSIRDVLSPFNHPTRGCRESDRVVAFDFLNLRTSSEPTAITLAGNGRISLVTVQPPSPPVRLSSQGVLVRGISENHLDFTELRPEFGDRTKVSEVIESIREANLSALEERKLSHGGRAARSDARVKDPLSSRESRERNLSLGTLGQSLTAEEALALLTVNRLRCKEGYLFDETRNKRILTDDPQLQWLWDWVERE